VIEQLLQADRLLTVDQVTQARDLYARVASLDPGNAIAVVGLARCALADGNDREAHALAARALAIDPEDDMARRLEARLAEVLAARGEPVRGPGRPAATASRGATSAASAASVASAASERRSFLDRLRGR
jgi:thioredoxin-like negative regulator of GroEL